jgi:hypothetical protein
MSDAMRVPAAPASGTHLVGSRVDLYEVLEHLSSETMVSSAFGAQLDKAREGRSGTDYVRARDGAEMRMLAKAAVIRCVDQLGACPNLFRMGEGLTAIRRFAVHAKLVEGAAVVGVMRAYQPWATQRSESGLVAVYRYAAAHGGAPAVDNAGEDSMVNAFRTGKAKRARNVAALLLADAEIALAGWVESWNRKGARRARA